MSSHFLVLALPRSRTAWLSVLLSWHEGVHCEHDPSRSTSGPEDAVRAILARPERVSGATDTALALWWPTLRALTEDWRMAVIWRSPAESFRATVEAFKIPREGHAALLLVTERVARGLELLIRDRRPLVMAAEDVTTEEGATLLLGHLAPEIPINAEWLRRCLGLRIAVDPARYLASSSLESAAHLAAAVG